MHARFSTFCQAAITGGESWLCTDLSVSDRVRGQGCYALVLVIGRIGMAMRRSMHCFLRRRHVLMRRPAMQHGRRGVSLDGNQQHRQVQHYGFEKT
ncbi:MAG: hypothetical protein AAB150_11660, partial [Pseudomonadota bacterium]